MREAKPGRGREILRNCVEAYLREGKFPEVKKEEAKRWFGGYKRLRERVEEIVEKKRKEGEWREEFLPCGLPRSGWKFCLHRGCYHWEECPAGGGGGGDGD